MARKCLTTRNDRRKRLSSLHQEKRERLLSTAKDTSLTLEERLSAQVALSEMPRDGSVSRFRNRCSITGRPRGNFRKFGISRGVLRDLASFGKIPGMMKSSW